VVFLGGKPLISGYANCESAVETCNELRGLQLNQRPLGYEGGLGWTEGPVRSFTSAPAKSTLLSLNLDTRT
jgi:hypothetical protein